MMNKKMAAALAAVTNYIKTEEESIYCQMFPEQQEIPGTPEPATNSQTEPSQPLARWNAGGRESLMQMRNMMQMKLFHR